MSIYKCTRGSLACHYELGSNEKGFLAVFLGECVTYSLDHISVPFQLCTHQIFSLEWSVIPCLVCSPARKISPVLCLLPSHCSHSHQSLSWAVSFSLVWVCLLSRPKCKHVGNCNTVSVYQSLI